MGYPVTRFLFGSVDYKNLLILSVLTTVVYAYFLLVAFKNQKVIAFVKFSWEIPTVFDFILKFLIVGLFLANLGVFLHNIFCEKVITIVTTVRRKFLRKIKNNC